MESDIIHVDWEPLVSGIRSDLKKSISAAGIAMRFHLTLSHIILEIAKLADCQKVIMSGGCFQNVILLENTIDLLRAHGFRPYWHQRVPPNDGGISLGQIAIANMLADSENFGKSYRNTEKIKLST